ncbi:hypothetical protein [Glycomyces buryatensis]|uniref:Uncharacterized protein n=1 Tax=Glycomyces buryatensis TaxID=2570927 RepID=A0A4S8QA36_9ACTN|nr:hypothetical protein [Glycomyces buryatensis]THV41307.1 hypothetical protein FAB82_12135 [Glycomyces buryatensis]
MEIRDLRKVIGQFKLEHRTIEVLCLGDRESATVWLRRTWPEPVLELGYATELDKPIQRLHLYRAEWNRNLRNLVKDEAREIWVASQRERGSA